MIQILCKIMAASYTCARCLHQFDLKYNYARHLKLAACKVKPGGQNDSHDSLLLKLHPPLLNVPAFPCICCHKVFSTNILRIQHTTRTQCVSNWSARNAQNPIQVGDVEPSEAHVVQAILHQQPVVTTLTSQYNASAIWRRLCGFI